jgi:hypothetical protein
MPTRRHAVPGLRPSRGKWWYFAMKWIQLEQAQDTNARNRGQQRNSALDSTIPQARITLRIQAVGSHIFCAVCRTIGRVQSFWSGADHRFHVRPLPFKSNIEVFQFLQGEINFLRLGKIGTHDISFKIVNSESFNSAGSVRNRRVDSMIVINHEKTLFKLAFSHLLQCRE